MDRGEELVQRTFAAAAAECGDNPIEIAKKVAERVSKMSPEDQKLFAKVAEAASTDYDPDPDKKPN